MIDISDPVALRAEAERRKRLRDQGRTTFDVVETAAPISERDANVLEKEEQLEVRKRFVVCGFEVRNTSQARASKVSPGIPDLIITHRALPIFLLWESKRQVGGKYSPAQLDFKADCERCGVTCRGGDRHDAEGYLIEIGRALYYNGVFEPIPSDNHPF